MSSIIIVIVTYNGMQWIEKCLDSIPKHFNIVIVDNNSTDGTVQFIQDNYSFIELMQQTKNLGFGAANNIGISYAIKNGADYVFLLNQDAYLGVDTVDNLIEIHKNNKEFGVLSPIHLNGKGNNLDLNFSNYINLSKKLWFDALKHQFTKEIYEVPFVNAAAWLVPIETFKTLGGFDPIFFHYGEDDNYCQRCKFHTIKIGVVPNNYIYHDREDRPHGISNVDNSNLKYLERHLKNKWSNINIDVNNDIENFKAKKRKLLLKLFLKLRFKKYFKHKKELRFVIKIIEEINQSRRQNKNRAAHYLKF